MSAEVTARGWRHAPARALLGVLRGYRTLISPSRPPACRFTPTCSAYAITAIERFGLARGGWLALRRLSRCHPFHRGGHDPVPPLVRPPGRTDQAPPVSGRLSHPAA